MSAPNASPDNPTRRLPGLGIAGFAVFLIFIDLGEPKTLEGTQHALPLLVGIYMVIAFLALGIAVRLSKAGQLLILAIHVTLTAVAWLILLSGFYTNNQGAPILMLLAGGIILTWLFAIFTSEAPANSPAENSPVSPSVD